MSSLARVRNSGSLFQSNVCILQFIFAWDLAVVRITGVSARRELTLKWIFFVADVLPYTLPLGLACQQQQGK